MVRLVKWLFGLIIVVSILVGLTPLAVRLAAVNWLEDHGYQANIQSLKVDFIFGEVELGNIDITTPAGVRVQVGMLEAALNVPALFRRELIIKKMETDAVKLHLGSSQKTTDEFLSAFFAGPGQGWQLNLDLLSAQNT